MELNDFRNSASPYHPYASHQVLASCDFQWFEEFLDAPSAILQYNFSHSGSPLHLNAQWQVSYEEFQDGCHGTHLGYWNWYLISMSPQRLAPTFSSIWITVLEKNDIWRFSRQPWWPSWISKRNDLSKSKSPCCPDAFHQVSTQSDLPFGSRYCNKMILAILNLHVAPMPHQVLAQSDLPFRSRYGLKIFKMASVAAILIWNRTILAILNLYAPLMPPIKFQLNQT